MTTIVSLITKQSKLKTQESMNFIIKIHAYFHSKMGIKLINPAQKLMMKHFGVQHQLMLIWIGKRGVIVMSCVHWKVQYKFYRKDKKI